MENVTVILQAIGGLVSGAWHAWLFYAFYGVLSTLAFGFLSGLGMLATLKPRICDRGKQSRLFLTFRVMFFLCVASMATTLWLLLFCSSNGKYCAEVLGLSWGVS